MNERYVRENNSEEEKEKKVRREKETMREGEREGEWGDESENREKYIG